MITYKQNYGKNLVYNSRPNKGFNRYYYQVILSKKLSQSEKRVLCTLYSIELSRDRMLISTKYITQLSGISNPYIVLKSLKEKKIIDYEKVGTKFDIKVLVHVKEERFLKVYNRMWDYPELTYSQVMVYSYLLSISNLKPFENGISITSKNIEKNTGINERTVRRVIGELVEFGIICEKENVLKIVVDFSKEQEEELQLIKKIESIDLENYSESEFEENDITNYGEFPF